MLQYQNMPAITTKKQNIPTIAVPTKTTSQPTTSSTITKINTTTNTITNTITNTPTVNSRKVASVYNKIIKEQKEKKKLARK